MNPMFLLYFIILIFFIAKSKADVVTVKTNDEFTSAINDLKSNRTIIIDGYISNLQNIETSTKNSISLIIKGKDEHSFLEFEKTTGLTVSNIDSLEITGISLHGSLNLSKLNSILLHEINHMGSIDINDITKNGNIIMKNFSYTSDIDNPSSSSINVSINGQMFIENSEFTANIGCTESIIKYIGNKENESKLNIKNSTFDCNNIAKAISAILGNITIESSKFYNGYSKDYGGFLLISNSNGSIKNCEFKISYSEIYGGVLYLLDNSYFEAIDIYVYNTIANSEGGIFYVSSTDPNSISVFKNINAFNNSKNCAKGAILSSTDYANIHISNLYGEGFGCTISNCCLFLLNEHSKLEIENSVMNNILITSYGMLFCVSSKSSYEDKVYIKGNNCTFINLSQTITKSSALIWNEAGIIDFS
eukprot:jgi/Orpsp1_1/1190986/evm.model.d7180000082685.1